MHKIEADQLRDQVNQKLAANGYIPKLKSTNIRKYEELTKAGMTSIEISHEFEKMYLSETEMSRANLFVSRLIREVLDSTTK